MFNSNVGLFQDRTIRFFTRKIDLPQSGNGLPPKKIRLGSIAGVSTFYFFSDFLNSTGGTIDSVRFLNKFYFDPKRPLLDISHFLFSKKHKRERKKTIIFIFYRFFKSMTSAKMILSLRIRNQTIEEGQLFFSKSWHNKTKNQPTLS